MPIRVLDPMVASQIAAGEVVERPASVVKELVENALDAGARRVSVEVRGGGVTELRIQDDGSGIPSAEIELAFQRHATSKLLTAEDLYAIGTLGFRGEALPSIASVAQITCISRTAAEPMGVELRIAGGEIQSRSAVGAPPGTTLVIRNLFYNIPVRREFLRSAGIETAAIGAIVTQYALAYPHVRFSLVVDGKPRLQTNGSGLLSDVLLSVYGLEIARAMLPVDFRDGGSMTGIAAKGLVSPPTLSRGSRDAMHLSVNGRAVAPRGQVAGVLDDAYHTLLMKSRFPYVVLAINVHPGSVDVNVHPTKSEVKFRDPERVRSMLARAIRTVIQGAVVVQGWEGGSVTPPADPEAEPAWADDTAIEPEPPEMPISSATTAPVPASSRSVLPVRPVIQAEASSVAAPPPVADAQLGSHASRGAGPQPPEPAPATPAPAPTALREQPYSAPVLPPLPRPSARTSEPASYERPAPLATPQPAAVPIQQALPDQDAQPAYQPAQPVTIANNQPGSGLPRLRALAQLSRMYLIAEGPEGDLYLVDQHAAHERITYERLMAQHNTGAVESQRLLIPQTIVVAPSAQETLLGAAEELKAWGFELEEAEQGVRVRAVPASVAPDEIKPAVLEVADHLSGAGGSTPAAWREALLVTLSCHTSIRTGHPLTLAEQQALIDQLSRCQGPRTCPHGRPTVIIMTKQQLTRQFGRIQ